MIFPGMAHAPGVRLAERYSIYTAMFLCIYQPSISSLQSHLEFYSILITHKPTTTTHRACSTLGKGWATKAFFSDDGSTAMEVAVKMAYRLFSVRHKDEERGKLLQSDGHKMAVITQADGYHGMKDA